jgi:bifunctional non-homologous end joining protein LigD
VGTGYDLGTLRALRQSLAELEQDRSPFADPPRERGVHWVRPELVAEVAFSEWTGDGRLRHPRFVGLRTDKPASEVVRERPQEVRA